jgi:hypothetical protein
MMFASAGADCPCGKEPKGTKDTKAATATFERFKKLVGEWQAATPTDKAPAKPFTITYRLTAGGSALVETIFPGTEQEMVTVYSRDSDGIALTHFCHLGNQPRMRAAITSDKDVVAFEFAGGTNLDPDKDPHMHSCQIRFVDKDHFTSTWQYYTDGKAAGDHAFSMVRVK